MNILALAAAVMAVGAVAPAPAEQSRPAAHERSYETPATCHDRITKVREARGLPKLDQAPAEPDDALLIAAVDQRVDGCAVLVMRYNTSDIRPLPDGGEPRLMPAQ